MSEVNPPQRLNPADRLVARHSADNRNRTGGLLSFASLVRSPPGGRVPAHWPAPQRNRLAGTETTIEAAPEPHNVRARRDPEPPLDPETKPPSEPAVEPLFCQLAVNQGLSSFVQANPATSLTPAAMPLREDLQNLLNGLTRRTAWGGDGRKGSARIELSEGCLAGATLVVHAEQRSVSVELELPPGTTASGWQQRILQRLAARGFAANVKVG